MVKLLESNSNILYLYAIGIWLIIVVIAIANGTFRNAVISPKLGDYMGHVISTFILCGIILGITYLFLKFIKIEYNKLDLIIIGIMWVSITLIFEFVFGHYVMKTPWKDLLADYNIFKGRIWVLVLIIDFFAPILCDFLIQKF
jgi:hypothetical protein